MRLLIATLVTTCLACALAHPTQAQNTIQSRFETAYYDWDAGRYAEALVAFEEILLADGGEAYLKEIALITGEWVKTVEIAPDGTNPSWSPDGSRFSYEVAGEHGTVTRIAALQDGEPRHLDEFVGTDAVFVASTNMVVYKYLRAGSELDAARAAAREGVTGEGRARFMALRSALARVDAEFTDIIERDVTTGREQQISADEGAMFEGSPVGASRDGSMVTSLTSSGDTTRVQVSTADSEPRTVFEATFPITNPALSPDGSMVVFEAMPRENRELYVASTDGSWSKRLTWEVQHDLFPRFVNNEQVFAVMGEGRHRRSYLHDVETGERMRLFHNNTVRTVSPEYEWAVSPDGSKVIVVAERDGDTISPERGIYLMDLTQFVSTEEVLERVRAGLASELRLRASAEQMFAPIEQAVRGTLSEVSTSRIYEYERDLFAFGSKFITQPGNAQAIDYLVQKLRSFGYEPELQTFEPREGIMSSNVIATLQGTTDPDVVYVVSSHFDSVERGPGADDNTSGTSALLEAARVMADSPQAATIQFAFFTGEEAGLLGSREFVRRAVQDGVQLVGALNNDMIGYANDNRLDNTIRYSNAGIRDIQHGAAMLFTDLITYDAKYYKSTDAHAYYEAYGDIVGGIGSYPILGNPHYHQTHDVLETINHQLVAEVSKTTVATLMLLASSPSRPTGLEATREAGSVALSWNPAVESHVTGYDVRWMDSTGRWHQNVVQTPSATLENVPAGATIEVRAIGSRRLQSWDAARVTAQ